jgi:hypothetical protein
MLAAFGVERMLAAQPTSLNRASRWFLGQAGPLLRYVCTFLPSACVGKFIEEADVKVFHSLSLLAEGVGAVAQAERIAAASKKDGAAAEM